MFPYIILVVGTAFLSLNGSQVEVNNLKNIDMRSLFPVAEQAYGHGLGPRDMSNFRTLSPEHVLSQSDPEQLLKYGCLAVMVGNATLLRTIVDRLYEVDSASINTRFPSGNNLLILLVQFQKEDKDVRKITEHVVDKYRNVLDVNMGDKTNTTPLFFAAQEGDHKAIELLAHFPNIELDTKRSDGTTPFAIAAECGHEKCVDTLHTLAEKKNQKLDVNNRAEGGVTPLIAVVGGSAKPSISIVMKLIKWGADPNISNSGGSSPLFFATISKNWPLANFLIKNSAAYDYIAPTSEYNMLHGIGISCEGLASGDSGNWCVSIKPEDISINDVLQVKNLAKTILTKNKGLWDQDSHIGYKPIHYAVTSKAAPRNMIGALLKAAKEVKVDNYVNVKTNCGRTILHDAAAMGNLEVVQCILPHNPDLTIEDFFGRTALDIAREHRNLRIVAKLEPLMPKPKKAHKKKRQKDSTSCEMCGSTGSCCCASSSSASNTDIIEPCMSIVEPSVAPNNNFKSKPFISVPPNSVLNFLMSAPKNVIAFRQKHPNDNILIGYTDGREGRRIAATIDYSHGVKIKKENTADIYHAFSSDFDEHIMRFGLKITFENQDEYKDVLDKHAIRIINNGHRAYVFPGRIEHPAYPVGRALADRALVDCYRGHKGAFVMLAKPMGKDNEMVNHRQFHPERSAIMS